MEEVISGIEYMREEIDASDKENVKSKKSLTQIIQEMWDTMKGQELRIKVIEEGEESPLKSPENIWNKNIEENSPHLRKDIPIKV